MTEKIKKIAKIGLAIIWAYIVSMTVIWLTSSICIYVENCAIKRKIDRRPELYSCVPNAYKPHKYVPFIKFYTWPVDLVKDISNQKEMTND